MVAVCEMANLHLRVYMKAKLALSLILYLTSCKAQLRAYIASIATIEALSSNSSSSSMMIASPLKAHCDICSFLRRSQLVAAANLLALREFARAPFSA